jgi:RPA family protein
MADNNGYIREVAHRIFAAELKDSNLQVKEGQDQFSPQYLITPTGAKVNRVFIVGTLTEKEDVGSDSEFWRGRIVDPTGAFFVTAGQYQPEAAQMLARTAPPEFVAVIGKPTAYTTKEGNVLTSIRAESMHIVDAATRDRWVVDAAVHTMKRLEKLAGSEPGAVKAREHYNTKVESYKELINKAVLSLKDDAGAFAPASPIPPAAQAPAVKAPDAAPSNKSMSDEEMKNFVEQQIVTRNKKGEGVKIEALGNPCKGAGMTLIQLETTIKGLMDEGRVYEPKQGVLIPAGA